MKRSVLLGFPPYYFINRTRIIGNLNAKTISSSVLDYICTSYQYDEIIVTTLHFAHCVKVLLHDQGEVKTNHKFKNTAKTFSPLVVKDTLSSILKYFLIFLMFECHAFHICLWWE